MAITPLYATNRHFGFPRSYVAGFVGSAGMSNLVLVGHTLQWDYLYPIYQVHLVIDSRFFQPTSNHYTLDYVFDWSSSQVYQSGSPIAAGVYVGFWPMHTEPTWRIQLMATFTIDESQKIDLTQPPNYWRPS